MSLHKPGCPLNKYSFITWFSTQLKNNSHWAVSEDYIKRCFHHPQPSHTNYETSSSDTGCMLKKELQVLWLIPTSTIPPASEFSEAVQHWGPCRIWSHICLKQHGFNQNTWWHLSREFLLQQADWLLEAEVPSTKSTTF